MKRTLLLAAAILSPLPACSQGGKGRIEIEEIWASTGSITVGEWIAVNGFAFASDGTMWVSDARAGQIVGVGRDGSFFRIAREGDGPGEVRGPASITMRPGGGMAVFDLFRNSVELFAGDGTFERRVQLNRQIWGLKGFLVLANGDFALSGALIGENGNLFRFDGSSGRLKRMRRVPQGAVSDSRARRNIMGGVLAPDPTGGFILSLNTPLRVLRFPDFDAEPTLVFEDPERIPFIGDDMIEESTNPAMPFRYRWFYPQTTGVFALDEQRLLNVVTMREEGTSLWQVIGRDGSILAETTHSEPYRVWAHDGEGTALATRWPWETQEQSTVRLRVEVRAREED